MAVTAVTQARLQESGVVGLQDLNAVVPSLQVRSTGTIGAITFSIRGVSNADLFEFANPPVVTYVDGVPIGRPEALGSIILDIARIEVLRGPQGTLYGRNSTGGNVNILTAKPAQKFDASAEASYGNFNEVQAKAMLNVPLSSTLAIRAAVGLRKNNGLFDTAGTTVRNYGAADELAGRISALWEPSNAFQWHLVLEGYSTKGTPSLAILTDAKGAPVDGKRPYDPRPVDTLQEPAINGRTLSVRSRMDWKVSDEVNLSYVAGYQDVDLRPQTLLGFIPYYRDTPVQTTSHEINVSFDGGRFHNILGASYFHQVYGSNAAAALPTLNLLAFVTSKITTKSWGVFNQSTFDLTDNLRLIGGIRYTSDDVRITDAYQTFCAYSAFPTPQFPLRSLLKRQLQLPSLSATCASNGSVFGGLNAGGRKSSSVTWRAGLSYDFSDTASGYATVSTGFKAAGINLGGGLSLASRQYEPEDVINYELGFKARMFDRRLSLNTALYYMNYTNIQVTQLLDLGGGNFANLTQNAAGAKNYGAEIEWDFAVTDRAKFSGFFNYIHATYSRYTNAIDDQNNATYNATGNFLPYAPEFSAQVRYEHQIPLQNGGSITPKAAVYWQSRSFLRPVNLPIDRVPAYTKTDLTLSYNDPTGRFTLDGFVHNLENRTVRNGGFVFIGAYSSSFDLPRTYGARLSYKF